MERKYPPKPLVAVAALVFKGNKVLLVKRKSPPGEGRWSLPGGCVEVGERLEDALRREVLEECGIEISVGQLVAVTDVIERDGKGTRFHYVILDFSAEYAGGELRPSTDVSDADWFSLEEALKLPLTRGTRRILEKLLKGEEKPFRIRI